MPTNQRQRTEEWIEAERAGRAEEAARRFRLVAEALPALAPSPGFAAAVLARLSVVRAPGDLWSRWWTRAAVAACVLSAGSASALLPLHGWMSALLASLRAVAWGVDQAAAGAYAWVSGALALWNGLAQAATVVGRHLAGPAPLAVLGLNLVVAAAALAALGRLMPLQEK
jgi:hypothetical protein